MRAQQFPNDVSLPEELLHPVIGDDVTRTYRPRVLEISTEIVDLRAAETIEDVYEQIQFIQRKFPTVSAEIFLANALIYGGAEIYYLRMMKNLIATLNELQLVNVTLKREALALEKAASSYNYYASEITKLQATESKLLIDISYSIRRMDPSLFQSLAPAGALEPALISLRDQLYLDILGKKSQLTDIPEIIRNELKRLNTATYTEITAARSSLEYYQTQRAVWYETIEKQAKILSDAIDRTPSTPPLRAVQQKFNAWKTKCMTPSKYVDAFYLSTELEEVRTYRQLLEARSNRMFMRMVNGAFALIIVAGAYVETNRITTESGGAGDPLKKNLGDASEYLLFNIMTDIYKSVGIEGWNTAFEKLQHGQWVPN